MSDPRSGRGSGRTPAGLPSTDRVPKRPPRPVIVEIATAMLIVSGFMSFFTSIESVISVTSRGELEPLLGALLLGLGLGTVAVGIALRHGRWWLFGVNYVAVAAFLELTSGSAPGLLFGAADLFVLVVLLVQRPWFAWRPEDEPESRADA